MNFLSVPINPYKKNLGRGGENYFCEGVGVVPPVVISNLEKKKLLEKYFFIKVVITVDNVSACVGESKAPIRFPKGPQGRTAGSFARPFWSCRI